MHKRDLLKAEIENLQKLLSQIMQLKLEGNLADAKKEFDLICQKHFNLDHKITDSSETVDFIKWLDEEKLGSEKLDQLAEFLYYELGVSAERNHAIAPKLNLLYNHLSDRYQIIHLVNLHRQENIQQYI